MINRRLLSQFDYLLFGATVLLALIGIAGIYSAGGTDGSSAYSRQMIWVAVGIAVFLVFAVIDYRLLTDHAYLFYSLGIGLLIAILLFGTEIQGNKSWIKIGGFSFQFSEIVKVFLIITLSRYLAEISNRALTRRNLLNALLIVGFPLALILLQGDLGTAILYFPIAISMLLVAGMRLRVLGILALAALCLSPVGWMVLKDYQKQRILSAFDPSLDPQGIGYQTRQSQIAIGSGGVSGRGYGNGLQSQLGFVPEIHTDFIFALLAEETGLLGGLGILALYFLLLSRLVTIAEEARDRTGILIAAGAVGLLGSHVVVNVGMVLGIMPAVGIPLPLLSYGGSSTISMFAALGLVASVHYRRFLYST